MSRNIPGPMQTALNTRTTTMCLCWKVVRQDGMIFGFTDHDRPLTFGGVTYLASTSFNATAIQDQLGLAVSNLEVIGALSSDAITELDLLSTRYDGAAVTVYLVNWQDVSQFASLTKGTIGQVTLGDLAFQAELRSLGQHFAQYVGSLCTPRCRVVAFGAGGAGLEAGCLANVAATVRTGTVASVTSRTTFSINTIGGMPADGTGGTLGGGFYAFGSVKFTTGNNSGLTKEIATHTGGVNMVTKEPFPQDIQVGDAVTLTADCDRTLLVCKNNWGQILNRKAEDYVPGKDQVFQVHS